MPRSFDHDHRVIDDRPVRDRIADMDFGPTTAMVETTCADCGSDLDVNPDTLTARVGTVEPDGTVSRWDRVPCWQDADGTTWVTCSCGFTDGWSE